MDRLWSPWRSVYVEGATEAPESECFLCTCARVTVPSVDSLVVARFEHCYVVLNRFPYNAGHLLIAPNDHVGELQALAPATTHDMMAATQQSINVLNRVISPHGFNFGANLGRAAGAGVPDHIHWHLVPRWDGDTNFMPSVGETKVMSHALESLWSEIAAEFGQTPA